MNHKQSSMAYGCLVFLTALSLASCSINQFNYRRIYSGAPLPRNEVAIVIKPDYCFITALEEDGKSPKQTPLLWGDIELLPGKYTLYIHWGKINTGYASTTITKAKEPLPIQIIAQPGRVYFIYPDFSERGRWKPVVIDNITDKDFESIATKYLNVPVWSYVEGILKGERRSLMQTEKGYWQ
jgi:hypothetical protein